MKILFNFLSSNSWIQLKQISICHEGGKEGWKKKVLKGIFSFKFPFSKHTHTKTCFFFYETKKCFFFIYIYKKPPVGRLQVQWCPPKPGVKEEPTMKRPPFQRGKRHFTIVLSTSKLSMINAVQCKPIPSLALRIYPPFWHLNIPTKNLHTPRREYHVRDDY